MCVCSYLLVVITTGRSDPDENESYRIISPFTINANIDRFYDMEKTNFIEELSGVLYVCVTSDIWSTLHTSYMGMTIHWIDANTLKLVSKLLCVRHFVSPHTNTRIASLLHEIFNEYRITKKVINIFVNCSFL